MIVLETGGIVASRYRLERPLAQGGMGAVWVARHIELDIPVALKIMAPEYASSPEAHARFAREAKACALIKSPYVVQIHDYGVTDGAPFIVMEWLEGEDLSARFAREGRLHPHTAAKIILDVLKGLRRAHELGIVHRDIKPGNIFLARQEDAEVVKILDFGIAKAEHPKLAGDLTRTGALLGSPFYMSPEQARGKHVDHRSDLWSVAVVFYQAIAGRTPFVGDEMADVLFQIYSGPIPPPSEIAPDLGDRYDAFFLRALARDPAARFQSAQELADAIAALLPPTPTEIMPTAPGVESAPASRRAEPSRRSQAPRVALAALAVLVVLVTLVLTQTTALRKTPEVAVAQKFALSVQPPPIETTKPETANIPEDKPIPSGSASAEATSRRSGSAARKPPVTKGPKRGRDPTFGF